MYWLCHNTLGFVTGVPKWAQIVFKLNGLPVESRIEKSSHLHFEKDANVFLKSNFLFLIMVL